MHHFSALLPVALLTLSASGTSMPQCPSWSTEFNSPDVDGRVYAQITHDDGSGEKLYVGGEFVSAGPQLAGGVAVWDGSAWSALGSGPNATIEALAFFDDGSGEVLYAGGEDTLQRFDGTSWTALSVTGTVQALHVHDDGSGPALFVGGSMDSIAGVAVAGLARFDGMNWSAMQGGVHTAGGGTGLVNALATFDDGSGAALYFGGFFSSAGATAAAHVGRWDGSGYTALGSGIDLAASAGNQVHALQPYIDGLTGQRGLYVGGRFLGAGGIQTENWARYSSSGWEALPLGMGWVYDFGLQEKASGPILWMATRDSWGNPDPNSGVRRWDGIAVTAPVVPLKNQTLSVVGYGAGSDEDVIVGCGFSGGNFEFNGTHHGTERSQVMRWDGQQWSTLGAGLGVGTYDSAVISMAVHDFGDGPELVVFGYFGAAGGEHTQMIARFDGSRWAPIGQSLKGWSSGSMVSYDEGNGSQLYVSSVALGTSSDHALALRFTGDLWESVGSPLPPPGPYSGTYSTALASFSDGAGEHLYVTGSFETLAGKRFNHIARWNGSEWGALGTGLLGGKETVNGVALEVHHDGVSEALYVGGAFTSVSGVPANNIARWDGASWSSLGAGVETPWAGSPGTINDMTTWNSPDGPVLVACGFFQTAGGVRANGLATWNGDSWAALGSGLQSQKYWNVRATSVEAFDPDGNGERLYVTGEFESAGGLACRGFAAWDGTSWSIPGVVDRLPLCLETFDAGDGRSLYLGGHFGLIDGMPSMNIARLRDVCGNDLGLPRCGSFPNSTGQSALLRGDGSASVTAASILLEASRLPADQMTLFFHGSGPIQMPWGDGLLCSMTSIQRMVPAGISNATGTYALTLDFNASYAVNFLSGRTFQFQALYRDPTGGPAGFNTTDALEITFRR